MRVRHQCKKEEEEEEAMKNSIRRCISCILPCGSLDVIRIVHSNGRVEEISGTIKAIDVMKANPKHVLKKQRSPSSVAADGGDVPRIVIVPPEAELKRGKIYFLMPLPPPEKNQQRRKKRKEHRERRNNDNINNNSISMTSFLVSDRYLTEILSEKVSTTRDRDRRRGRVAVWRPNLETISELPSE